MRKVSPAGKTEGLRAYGEMVGILWKARQFAAAIRLEQALEQTPRALVFQSLLFLLAIDNLRKRFEVANLDGSALHARTHLLPAQTDGTRWEAALNL